MFIFRSTRFHHCSSLRGSPSTWSSRVLRCAISFLWMSRHSAFSKVTGTVLSCLQRLGRTSSEFITSSLGFMHRLVNALEHTLECADYSSVKVESLQIPAESSRFDVHCGENGSFFNLLVFSVRRGGAQELLLGRGAQGLFHELS